MRIGELGSRAGVSARTVRHYEDLGLLTGRRRSNGYRDYDADDLRLLKEVRSLVDLGFTLEETRPFLNCLRAGSKNAASCPDSLAVYSRKIAEVDGYLARLHQLRNRLQAGYQQAAGEQAVAVDGISPVGCAAPTLRTTSASAPRATTPHHTIDPEDIR